MKPGKPLERRTELCRKTPLQPGCGLQRRTPLNPVSGKRRRENTVRRVVVSALREIAQGRCARCGRRDLPVHGHERRGRAQGADIVHPDALLDPICNGWCEDNPRIAAWTGWRVNPKWPHDPALQPWEARALDGAVVDLRALVPEEASA